MMKKAISYQLSAFSLLFFLSFALLSVASAFDRRDYCAGLPSSDTVEAYAYCLDDSVIVRNWTSTGVSEQPVGNGKSAYWFSIPVESGKSYDVKCRTTIASPQKFVSFGITSSESNNPSAADIWTYPDRIVTNMVSEPDNANIQNMWTLLQANLDMPVSSVASLSLDTTVEGAFTLRQLLRLMSSALFGKASGGGTTTITFRDLADTKNRIQTAVDSKGNRTAVILNGD